MVPIRYFDFDRSKLNKSEKKVLDALIKAGEVIHDIWQKQVDPETGDLLLYPFSIEEDVILKAAKKDLEILSPYTVVIENGGKLQAVPYADAYSKELELFYKHLEDAINASEEEVMKNYLSEIISAYKVNDFDKALIHYLQNDTKIEFLCGPLETYEDKLLGKKRTFQYNLRVLQEEPTKEMKKMIYVIKNIHLRQPKTSVGASMDPSKISIRVDDVIMFSGRQSKFLVSSTNLPNEPELVDLYGTKVVVYTTSMYKKFEEKHLPLLPLVKGDGLGVSVDEMKTAMFRGIGLHEIAEGTVKFAGMADRLGKHIDYVRELNADLIGIDSAKYYVLNGLISLQEYRYLLASFIIFALDMCNQFRETGELNDYVIGDAILFNRLFESGALKLKQNTLFIEFTQMAKDVELLSNITVRILEDGQEEDAAKLLMQYGDRSIFEKLPRP